jgi:hypothetical protein
MIAAKRRVQREGEVIHLVAREFFDFSNLLRTAGQRKPGQKPEDVFIPEQHSFVLIPFPLEWYSYLNLRWFLKWWQKHPATRF